jgi:hypothetical protein
MDSIYTSWQDIFFAVTQVYFVIALIPQMRAQAVAMPVLQSSIPIAFGVTALAIPHASYGNWFAMVASVAHGLQWAYVAYIKWKA